MEGMRVKILEIKDLNFFFRRFRLEDNLRVFFRIFSKLVDHLFVFMGFQIVFWEKKFRINAPDVAHRNLKYRLLDVIRRTNLFFHQPYTALQFFAQQMSTMESITHEVFKLELFYFINVCEMVSLNNMRTFSAPLIFL